MIQSRLWISAAIIGVVIIVSFALSVPHTREIADTSMRKEASAMPSAVVIKDSFRKGTHTISGTVVAGNACSTVAAQAFLVGDTPSSQSIQLALTIPVDSGICLQIPTPLTFSTTIAAPANLPITATINGISASTTSP